MTRALDLDLTSAELCAMDGMVEGSRIWVNLWFLPRGRARATLLTMRDEPIDWSVDCDILKKHYGKGRYYNRIVEVQFDKTVRVPRWVWRDPYGLAAEHHLHDIRRVYDIDNMITALVAPHEIEAME